MFDYVRVAGLAALTLAAAGATGQVLPVPSAPILVAEPADNNQTTEALPPAPAVTPLPEVDETPKVEDAPAASLAALVRRHAGTKTSDREQECLAAATYFESKGEPLEGQLAVARVILNRAQSGRFAATVCGVVKQPGQFSFVRGGAMPAIARGSNNWRTAVAIAHIAQNDLWTPSVSNALYFHARYVAPGWRMARVGAVGNHVFYR